MDNRRRHRPTPHRQPQAFGSGTTTALRHATTHRRRHQQAFAAVEGGTPSPEGKLLRHRPGGQVRRGGLFKAACHRGEA